MRDKHSGFWTGLYTRNELFIWLSAAVFLGSIIVGYAFSGFLDSILAPVLQNFQQKTSDGTLKLETFSLFLNNVSVATLIYVGGVVFGLVTAILLVNQGAFIGYVASKYPLSSFLIFTVPHGIFEVSGIIFAGAGGFKLTSILINLLRDVLKIKSNISIKNQLKYLLEANVDEFKDSLALFIIAVILLLVAAFIEANLSVAWGIYIQSSF